MDCIFCDIINHKIPATILFENDHLIAFRDLNPQASTHILIIPKIHIATVNHIDEEHETLLGEMLFVAKDLAKNDGIAEGGYRLVFNVNPNGGQMVYHIHMHLIGGRKMTWPPG
jgi:histidine triad (HIT) family protein